MDLDGLEARDAHLPAIPGLLDHDLFLSQVGALYLGEPGGVIRTERRPREN